jgi:hypothetical protein
MSTAAVKKEKKEVISIPTFNGHNYSNWSVTTPHILYDKKAKKSIKNTCNVKVHVIDHAACFNEK